MIQSNRFLIQFWWNKLSGQLSKNLVAPQADRRKITESRAFFIYLTTIWVLLGRKTILWLATRTLVTYPKNKSLGRRTLTVIIIWAWAMEVPLALPGMDNKPSQNKNFWIPLQGISVKGASSIINSISPNRIPRNFSTF